MQTIPMLYLEDIQEDRPMPSRNHSIIAQNLSYFLQSRYREQYRVYPQLSLQLDGWATIPDISVFRVGVLTADWHNDEEEVLLPPDLVIEVLSPKQNLQPLVGKILRYMEKGVRSCWLVMPMTHTIILYQPGQQEQSFSTGVMHDPQLGMDLPLDEVFA